MLSLHRQNYYHHHRFWLLSVTIFLLLFSIVSEPVSSTASANSITDPDSNPNQHSPLSQLNSQTDSAQSNPKTKSKQSKKHKRSWSWLFSSPSPDAQSNSWFSSQDESAGKYLFHGIPEDGVTQEQKIKEQRLWDEKFERVVKNGEIGTAMTSERVEILRNKSKSMFYHAFNNYMDIAFPMDELDPLRCTGKGPDRWNPQNLGVNDVLGDYLLTLIDSLDMLAVINDRHSFARAVHLIIKHLPSFDINSRVQVFESNIRILGGLISGHLIASTDFFPNMKIKGYNNELLDLAKDLGERLLKAWKTPTGIPFARVNLRYGVLENELNHTCVAAAGTLILEFGLLSRLTGDPKFEDAAKSTIYELWRRRSPLNLVGNTINVISGEWLEGIATIGAGVDSFYEYLLKAYILFNDRDYALIFRDAYKAVMTHIKDMTGLFYKNVHFYNGGLVLSWIDSLSAFWPGLQVLLGDLDNAIKLHQMYYQIWRRYDGLPERWDFFTLSTNIPSYLLRPELIESTYFLYRSTKDPYYLLAGERFLYDIETHMKTRCGYCSIRNLFTKEKDTRMESFFLAETLKYLYLLFDTENVLNKKDSSWVFTTEAHVVWLPDELRDEIVKTGKEWNANEATKEKEVKEEPKANSKGKDSDSSSSSSSPPSAPPKQPPSPQCPVYPLSIMSAISSHPIVPFAAYLAGLNDDYDQVMCAAPAPSPSDSSSGSTPAKKKTKKKKKKKNANKSGTREKRSVEDDVDDSEINSHDDAESDESEPLNSDDAVEGESDQESNESTLNKYVSKFSKGFQKQLGKWIKKIQEQVENEMGDEGEMDEEIVVTLDLEDNEVSGGDNEIDDVEIRGEKESTEVKEDLGIVDVKEGKELQAVKSESDKINETENQKHLTSGPAQEKTESTAFKYSKQSKFVSQVLSKIRAFRTHSHSHFHQRLSTRSSDRLPPSPHSRVYHEPKILSFTPTRTFKVSKAGADEIHVDVIFDLNRHGEIGETLKKLQVCLDDSRQNDVIGNAEKETRSVGNEETDEAENQKGICLDSRFTTLISS